MPLLFRDFAYAHALLAIKNDTLVVERGTGFERTAYPASKSPDGHCPCHPGEPLLPLGAAPSGTEPVALPRNTRLLRMRLSSDHQIDPSEVVAIAAPADRDTAYRYEVAAIPVDDRTVDVVVRAREPDININVPMIARVQVLLFRVA